MLQFVCVLPSQYEASECMLNIYSLCNKKGISFDLRVFDSRKYSKDAKYIESLPAIHVYVGKEYMDTLHEREGLFQKIQDIIQKEESNPSRISIIQKLTSFLKIR